MVWYLLMIWFRLCLFSRHITESFSLQHFRWGMILIYPIIEMIFLIPWLMSCLPSISIIKLLPVVINKHFVESYLETIEIPLIKLYFCFCFYELFVPCLRQCIVILNISLARGCACKVASVPYVAIIFEHFLAFWHEMF